MGSSYPLVYVVAWLPPCTPAYVSLLPLRCFSTDILHGWGTVTVKPSTVLCCFARSNLLLLGLLFKCRGTFCPSDACRHIAAGEGHVPTKPASAGRSACSSVETSHTASARAGPKPAASAPVATFSTAFPTVTAMLSNHSTMVRERERERERERLKPLCDIPDV
jgi:hypothetical protein